MDPTTAPVDDEMTSDDAEINAAGDTYTVTIANYATLKKQVEFKAYVDNVKTKISSDGKITAKEDDKGNQPPIKVTVKKISGYKITSVKNGETDVTATGDTYTIDGLKADATITVTTVATYDVMVTGIAAASIKVKTSDAADATPTEITVAGTTDTPAVLEKGNAMEFEVNATITDGNRLKVYYITDGSADVNDRTEIEAKTTGTGDAAKTTYTVSKEVIDSLDGSIEIVLVNEAKVPVTVDGATGAKVAGIEVEVPDTAEGAAAGATKWEAYTANTNNSVFPGETFKFRVKAAANYAIKSAKAGSELLTAGTAVEVTTGTDAQKGKWTPFEVTPKEAVSVVVETELDSAASRTLTYTLTGDTGSAIATITSVTPAATTDAPNPTATTDVEAMKAALGIDNLTLKSGETISVLSAPKEIKVEIAPTADYELIAKDTSGTIAANDTKSVFSIETGTTAIEIKAATQDVTFAGDSKYFKPIIKAVAEGEDQKLSDLTVQTSADVVKGTGDAADTYEVKAGVRTVTFTVKAKAGFKVKDFAESSPVKSVTAGAPDGNGNVVYTVTLAARKLTGTSASPEEITAEAEAIKLKAEVEKAEGFDVNYGYQLGTKGTDDADYTMVNNTALSNVDYGVAFKAVITPNTGCRLDEVSYVMGTGASVNIPVDEETGKAEIEIAEMTGDVKITVKSGKDLKLADLKEVGETSFDIVEQDSDKIYAVEYGKKYAVGVMEGNTEVPAKDVSVVVKDESGATVAMTNPIVTRDEVPKRTINLASKNLAGQEITAEVSYKGKLVGTYIMSVEKKTTSITVNGGEAIEQSVDSLKTYDLTTDGDLDNVEIKIDGDIKNLLTVTKTANGKLQVIADYAKRSDIADSKEEGEGDNKTTTWTAKTATITVSATDDTDVETSVEISLTPLFNEDAAPTVSSVDAANNVLNVKIDMADVAVPKKGSVWYEVTATANEGEAGEDGKKPTLPDDLYPSAKAIVKMSDGRVALRVSDKELGEETSAWAAGYDVTAKLVYINNKPDYLYNIPTSSVVAESKVGELKGATTKAPLFEDALKLKKAPGAPAKLYTGQTGDIVIAVPQWSKKFSSYQILSDNVYDANGYLDVDVNADGNIIIHGVSNTENLGKHTINVVATADETGKYNEAGYSHTTYASRATIAVNVVKGINEITVTQPSESIYKDPKKAGSLKLGVIYNEDTPSYSGSKEVTAPATKKVKWSIVDATSSLSNIKEAPAYLKVGDTKNGVNVKNGTVTVAQKFTRDERHANNNRFKVLVEADDFAGNTTKGLSEVITITADALDISTLVIAKYNDQWEKVVTAVHDIKDNKPVSVLASDVAYGYVYALPAGASVTVGTKLTTPLMNLAAPLENLTISTTNKKVLTLGYDLEDNRILVHAAGKKAGIKVVANDGSKKTHTMNLTLDYKATEGKDLALGIAYRKDNDAFYSEENESLFDPAKSADAAKAGKANETPVEVKFNTTGAARLDVQLYVGDKADGTSTKYSHDDVWSTNYKLAVKGGKAVYNANGYATIVTTAKETTLTLTDQTKEAKTAKKKAYVYKIVNEAYDNTKLAKAPKVSVKGSLYAYGTVEEQNKALQLTVLDAANKNVPYAKDKTVKVELDWSARTDKNACMLNNFASKLDLSAKAYNTAVLGETGTISLFSGNDDKTDPISFGFGNYINNSNAYNDGAGTYKLKVTVGKGDGDKFVAETLPATVNVKVVKNKVFTFKPTTSYTINKVDGGAVLTGKANLNAKAGELVGMNFSNLQNVNLKGKSNKFTHYFMIASDEKTGTQRLTLNINDPLVKAMIYEPEKDKDGNEVKDEAGNVKLSNTLKENPVINIPKDDLTGYISYYATPSVNYYSNDEVYGTVKITVKIAPEAKAGKPAKASQKYATNRAEVALEKDKSTEMNVIVNGSYVSVAYAMVDDTKKGNAEELAVDLAGNEKGQIVLKTTKAVEEGKTYSTNLLIVPISSYYSKVIDGAPAAKAAKDGEAATVPTKQDLIKKYGIAVKVSVLASKSPAKTPDPTGTSEDEKEDQPVSDEEKNALTAEVEKTVEIGNDAYEEEPTGGTGNGTIDETTVKNAIEAAIKGVEGWENAVVTVSDITVTDAPTTSAPGKATTTVTVKKNGYESVTLSVELKIAQLENTQTVPPTGDGGDLD